MSGCGSSCVYIGSSGQGKRRAAEDELVQRYGSETMWQVVLSDELRFLSNLMTICKNYEDQIKAKRKLRASSLKQPLQNPAEFTCLYVSIAVDYCIERKPE